MGGLFRSVRRAARRVGTAVATGGYSELARGAQSASQGDIAGAATAVSFLGIAQTALKGEGVPQGEQFKIQSEEDARNLAASDELKKRQRARAARLSAGPGGAVVSERSLGRAALLGL